MNDTVRIVGAPTDYGTNRRGVDMGPSAIRYADLAAALSAIGHTPRDHGDLRVGRVESDDPGRDDAKYLAAIESVCTRLADDVSDALAAGETPLVLGGDHSVAIGSVVGSARDADVGVLWFDAHGDLNTPVTTPSGNVHGMALAAILGLGEFAETPWANAAGVDPETVALVGVRDLDPGEREAIREHGIAAFSISDIDDRGITAVVAEALDAACGRDGVHVSLDLDWLDPTEAPGVGTPVRGGVTYREAHAALERVADAAAVRSLELVEVNPILDDHNRTAELAVELAASALGKRIL
ncbi:arginase [Haloplanus rubicundus]|uniref:Arginase n=1 Tax=Haloplanus rubicundus TaxID=1547898 RepID=A0A345EF14_9EURY|nr:arginase [Haloplanus rubicundus]AXG07369.1 arginase [Haloplanus rubicundus]AXG10786.1 arginase [Haloplanus rubicundus]